MRRKKPERLKNMKPEILPRRTFIKKAAIGIALLPYVAPLIESFALVDEDAGMAYATTKCPKGGRGVGVRGGRGRSRGKISPPQQPKTRPKAGKQK